MFLLALLFRSREGARRRRRKERVSGGGREIMCVCVCAKGRERAGIVSNERQMENGLGGPTRKRFWAK